MNRSPLRASAFLAVFAIAATRLYLPAMAVPVLTLQSDWAALSVEGRFSGQPGTWSDSYEGPVFGGVALLIEPVFVDEFGRSSEFSVYATVWEPSGPSSIGAFSVIEPRFGNSLPHIGRADVDATWRFIMGDEAAHFSASASGLGGSFAQAGFSLYDETDDALVAGLSQGPGGGTSGLLLASHEYTMNFFSHTATNGSGDPFAGFEFTTDATIVPEPAHSFALLGLLLSLIRGKQRVRRLSPRDAAFAQT